ncbi:AT-rich interactive domain-containing protein 2 [Physcomitrium patens]|uniref:ARID domain-containing protein n=1 Tax=Physcomitrium patens TaxID=3218 RepID=A0A2K1IZW1_PHYPA|nr:AT-rich interactive domain-containing protein 2-like [Physcomitrium patens]PNR34808.1 hypothetical protein PHYPA_022706 [Physcomitrium patens]|eukprot:XP_024402141.1 AT-rich interactive domain-containing protein 2-like [Physcomitrella patens]
MRAGREMARPPSDMKNKRKEVEVEDAGEVESGGAEKRSKPNALIELGGRERDEDETSSSGGSLLNTVQRILEARKRFRPLPVLMGDKVVDLSALHSRVNSMGGYSKVTEAGMWSVISDALGLGLECGPGLKLVYVKYLKALEADKYVKVVKSISSLDVAQPSSSVRPIGCWESGPTSRVAEPGCEMQGNGDNGDYLPEDSIEGHTVTPQLAHGQRKESDSGSDNAGAAISDEDAIGDLRVRHENQLECRQSLTSEDWATTYASGEHLARNSYDRGDQAQALRSDDVPGASEDWYEGEREENILHQREALFGMLEWIKRIAMIPGNPPAALETDSSGKNDDWVSQCQMLTAKVRSVLWKEPRAGDSSIQAKPMPSLYYDEPVRPDAQALERLRATRERLAHYGFQPGLGSNCRGGTSSNQDRNDASYWGASGAHVGQRSGRHSVNYSESAFARYNQQRKKIPIGPDFQADMDRWVPRELLHRSGDTTQDESGEGPSSSDEEDNDDRWLGSQVWPQPCRGGIDTPLRVGKGRPASCDCHEPGSMNCVRLHITAARAKLRCDLGQAFNRMGFDQMGECVADQWSKDDEHTFRMIARTHPASKGRNFWDYLPNALPFKTRMELNSYYFNVFVLRRRALQNRLGDKIDSDDDEGELGGESDDSVYASTDDDEEDEEVYDLSDGADDGGSEGIPDAYPLKVLDDVEMRKFRNVPDYPFSAAEGVVHHGGDRVRTGSLVVDLEDVVNYCTHDHADSSHVVLVWDDKHLESSNLVPQGRHWEDPHWDTRDHQQGSSVLGEDVSSRQLSPPTGKEGTQQSSGLGDLWTQNMEMAPKQEKDRLLSTNGVILELFGDDVRN